MVCFRMVEASFGGLRVPRAARSRRHTTTAPALTAPKRAFIPPACFASLSSWPAWS
jgi:hypothetical protein